MTPTQHLEYELKILSNGGITTAAQLAAHLNAKNEAYRKADKSTRNEADSLYFGLSEDAEFWARLDIHTARELAVHLDMSSFSDFYKEENGFRPCGYDYDEVMYWLDRHFGVD